TVFKDRVVTKTKPVYSEIEVPCDSVGGKYNFGSGGNRAEVNIKNGKVYFKFLIDSTRNSIEKKYRTKLKQDSLAIVKRIESKTSESTEKVKVVWPWWVWFAIIVGGLSVLLNLYQKFFIS